ncbi:hypothetical protein [Actinomadura geliboluensis]|uniref:hypothetical protein n=1 Tax=Actinomadura geliboluensis TaxID=882440 RepID=UPI002620D775|nr:hypothetical protein [Actinomadura geliboluensis]
MTDLAAQHLTHLQHQLHTADLDHDLRQPAIPPELARLTHVLARYHHQIADGFGTPHPATAGVRDGAHRVGILLQQAEHHLGPPADTQTPQSALAEKLRAASIALGCGLDLLSTHFPVTSGQATTSNAGIIAAPDTARTLLHQLSTYTATLGHLAYGTNAPSNQAGPLLLKAAVLARICSQDQTPPPINPIPFHHIPDRIPPQIGESADQASTGINASIHRLSNPASATSVTTWRYLARAAAIICDLNRKTIRQLIYRLNEPDHLSAMKQAAADLRYVGTAWRGIVRRWDEQIGGYGHPANGPATDAGDLIIRLGRLLHTDPAWTPSPRASSRLRPPHELARDLAHAAELATITLKTVETCNTLAAHHHAAINDVVTLDALNWQKKYPTRVHRFRLPASARELSTRYDIAQTKGRRAIASLGQAIQYMTPGPTTLEEARLIIHRTTAISDEHQVSLATTDFPTSISDCLNSEQTSHEDNAATHISPSPRTPKNPPTA